MIDVYYDKCSQSILRPIPMSIMPAHNSARRLIRLPQYVPNKQPIMVNRKETIPMMVMGQIIEDQPFIPMKANEMPIANASMLVATAIVRMTGRLVGSKW